jgi:aspartyl-tRNA(Asn)/glutamyl-tRNA(Gln) amidotransferase subunit B
VSEQLEVVIGLEVHCQLNTLTKLFCGCSTRFGMPPNTQICPVCTGQPGVLPVLNRQVVIKALRLALALRCTIRRESRFARKNYFYPDLPKGYQISQYDQPIAEHGTLELIFEQQPFQIGITRVHIEEDAGKSIHQAGARHSLVDLNRAGVPLLEIVSEPVLHSPEQAAEYMRTLRGIVRALGISDGNLEEGSLRCDANVSLRPSASTRLGDRTEIKNINSFRFVQKALEYEIGRQRRILRRGERVVTQTLLWDADRGVTEPMRSKEEAHDYRYFPEPDLPPLTIPEGLIASVAADMPELPVQTRRRLVQTLGLSNYDAASLTREQQLVSYFETVVALGAPAKRAANWILTEVLKMVSDPRALEHAPVSPAHLAQLLSMIESEQISGKIAKAIWPEMWSSGEAPEAIALRNNLFQQSDDTTLLETIDRIVATHRDKVADYRRGKDKLFGFFVGQVMRETAGKANPQRVNALLRQRLLEK